MLYEKAPEAPAWVKRVARAHEKWEDVWLALEQTRVFVRQHGDLVAQYCIAWADMRDALERMQNSKLVAEKRMVGSGENAKVVVEKVTVSPFYSIYKDALSTMDRIGLKIGLDPANPLDEAKRFSDYREILCCNDGDDDVDGSDGTAGGDAASETEIQSGSAGQENVLDQR